MHAANLDHAAFGVRDADGAAVGEVKSFPDAEEFVRETTVAAQAGIEFEVGGGFAALARGGGGGGAGFGRFIHL